MYGQFQKRSARPTGKESSNGMGLALVKSLTDRQGGEIRLESEPGEGATFNLRIPEMKSEGLTSKELSPLRNSLWHPLHG